MQKRRLETTGLAKPGKTRGLTGMGPGLAHQEVAGRVFGQVWNRTERFFWSKPRLLAGYPDPLLTLFVRYHRIITVCFMYDLDAMCGDKHLQGTVVSKNFLGISIKHQISSVVHLNISPQTLEQTSADRLTAIPGTVGITSNLQRCTGGCTLSTTCKLTVIHSLVTCSLEYIAQDCPLFVIIFLTFSTPPRHNSTITSARCDSTQIEPNDGRFIQCCPG